MPPKTVARLIRFERAVDLLRTSPGMRMADLAADCGYFDQAHLNREFRSLAEMTPRECAFEFQLAPVPVLE